MASRPNILIFLTDSTLFRHLGCYGNQPSITPYLDRMAAEGICFRNAYATTPLCHPSRSAMLSGLYPHTNGAVGNNHVAPDAPVMNPKLPTFYSLLHDAGYRCGMVTQEVRPNGASIASGFDDLIAGYPRFKAERAAIGKIPEPMTTPEIPSEGMVIDSLDDSRDYNYVLYGKELLNTYIQGDQSWVFSFEFDAPHGPCLPPRQFWEMISPDTCNPPPNVFDPLTDRDPRYRKSRERGGYAAWDIERWRGAIRLYRGLIALMDDLLGRVLEVGANDNTLVIFSSDHGELVGNHGLWDKFPCVDDAVHVPLVMRWPNGIRAGQVEDAYVSAVDWLPTFCELAGIEPPALHHGRSLVPFFQGEKPADWRTGTTTTFYGSGKDWWPLRAYRDDHYKLVFDPFGMNEFYDMQNDPWERQNLIADPQYQPLITQYAKTLGNELRHIGDSMADIILSEKSRISA